MDPILVTGGAGYIGSHACQELARSGFLPIAYDNLSTGHAYAVKWGPFVHADLNDREKLDETFKTYNPKAVLHFAGSALVSESVVNPGLYYQNNVGSTLSLLEAMRLHAVPYLIFSSSCAIYGDPSFTPINESHPHLPISPYGRSKLMVEEILADFEKAHGLCSVALRYFNVAGADLKSEIGENHKPETHLIPSIIEAALGMKEEILVYGTDFPSRDGSAIRDYVHVEDLARAHVLALKWLFSHKRSVSINLGTGTGHSVLEIIKAVQTLTPRPLPVRLENRRPGDPSILTADNRLAKDLLGWTPLLSDLETIVGSAWNWHKLLKESTPILRSTLTRLEEHKCSP